MTEFEIRTVRAREILDCRLEPTLRVEIETRSGATGSADVPAGRSTGTHEAIDRRDGGDRYRGRGVRDATDAVENRLAPALAGTDVRDQSAIDATLCEVDGTANKSSVGGNATAGVSLAALRAAAVAQSVPLYRHLGGPAADALPVPLLDMIEGGELAATELGFQEHHLLPVAAPSFAEAIRTSAEVYYELGDLLAAEWGESSRNVGVEGGYTPPGMVDPRDAFDAMVRATEECGYGGAFVLGIDAAATHLYDPEAETYAVAGEDRTPDELLAFYEDLCEAYPLASIEDPFREDDFERTAALTRSVDAQIVGDDLFVTDTDRIARGVERGAGDALLLKVDQVGTVTEAMAGADRARAGGLAVQVSERSGQTPDTWLADLAVGLGAEQIKTGVTRGERTEQYNRLLEIEAAASGEYAGWPT